MKIADVAQFLKANIVRHTDLFSILSKPVVSVVPSGSTVTVTTASAHGIKTGDLISAPLGRVDNPITAVVQVGSDMQFTTALDHDLTLGYHPTVELSGFTDSGWNGSHSLNDVPNRRNFVVSKPNTPTLNGNEVLREALEVGSLSVGLVSATATGPTTFTYDVGVDLSGRSLYVPSIVVGSRVSACVSLERAAESYTRQQTDKLWAFVIPSTEAALNKDRLAVTDARTERGRSSSMLETFLDGFDVFVFAPCSDEIAGVRALDTCRHTLFRPMLRSLRGVKFDTGTADGSTNVVSLISHGLETYSQAFLIYRYSFQFISYLTDEDQNDFSGTVAFRDIEFTSGLETGATFGTININLDREPI